MINGTIRNSTYHNRRFNATRMHFFNAQPLSLEHELVPVAREYRKGTFVYRIVYDRSIRERTLRVYSVSCPDNFVTVNGDALEYGYKYEQRGALRALYPETSGSTEIIIIKDGFVTDTGIGNLVFYDGKNWVTPETTLLPGTMRQFLLDTNVIRKAPVRAEDLGKYQIFKQINALRSFTESPAFAVNKIIMSHRLR